MESNNPKVIENSEGKSFWYTKDSLYELCKFKMLSVSALYVYQFLCLAFILSLITFLLISIPFRCKNDSFGCRVF